MMLQDPRLRATFIATMVLSGLIVLVTQIVGEDDSFPIVVALIILMSMIQMGLLFLWNGDPMGSALVAARRFYMQGDFAAAARALEQIDQEKADAAMLALLGNTYRQMKRLQDSEEILRQAFVRFSTDKLVLYGLGRTLLVRGQYEEAIMMIERALQNAGRNHILVELAQAQYYAGYDKNTVAATAQRASRVLNLEQYRTLYVNFLLYNLVQAEKEAARRIITMNRDGLTYWQSEARRFADEPYGRRVAGDVVAIRAIIDEDASKHE